MKRNYYTRKNRFIGLLLMLSSFAISVSAQLTLAQERKIVESSSDRFWYTMFFLGAVILGAAYYIWHKSKKASSEPELSPATRKSNNYYNNESYEIADGDKELEWLRKAKKPSANMTMGRARRSVSKGDRPVDPETKLFQEKMKRLQYSQLPINSFHDLSPSKSFDQLVVSNDPSLLNAIEQANDEFEEDEEIRDLAVRILTAFRTKNSVEALAQIALYDLSSNLRSKAVSILTDFDHESVFEIILLACADPTREVRAAAARGLFRLNFDRANAWKRIMETGDEFRMRHAARAAVESGIVLKSFERLVHDDLKVAYEAFTLVALLIKSGEASEIFDSIKSHKDDRVKLALVHVLKIFKDERTLSGLHELHKNEFLPTDVAQKVKELILSFDQVLA